jgi:alpha-amylase
MKTAKDWIGQTNVYEVNIRQYTPEGTIRAFRPHLPRLRAMGVDTLWFMPLTPIAALNRKGVLGSPYACSAYTGINPEFGTEADFKALVDEAHHLGFKIIIDWVANHTGWDHVWTMKHPEWYKKDTAGGFLRAAGMDDIIELDFTNASMRKALIAAMRFWVEAFEIDGFRCDLASWVPLAFWLEAKEALDRVKPLFWLAEADALDHPDYMQVFDAAYSWTWMHQTESFYRDKAPFSRILPILHRYREAPGMPAWFTSNHDENTWNGTEYEKYGEAAPMLAVFSVLYPGLPLLYSGQEIPNNKRLAFFEKDELDWDAPLSLSDFYTRLLTLQRSHPALHFGAGHQRVYSSADEQVLCFLRSGGDKEVLTLLNFSAQTIWLDLYDRSASGRYTDLFTEEEVDLTKQRSFRLGPWGYRVLVR